MLCSIIMPAYNREAYIAQALESVFSQTYPDWELIVVDDGSTDQTSSICRQYVERAPSRVRLISQQNQGVTAARNAGIRAASGEVITFLDSDDEWVPRKLATQLACYRSGPPPAFVYTGYELIDRQGQRLGVVRPDPNFSGDISRRLWLEDNAILGPTLMVSRELLVGVGMFNESLKGAENLDLRIRLARRGEVRCIEEPLYRYRKHGASLSDDLELMMKQHYAVIELHFPVGVTRGEMLRLRRRAEARVIKKEADWHFAACRFTQARRGYLKSWRYCDSKAEVIGRILRTFLGAKGNDALRRLKLQQRTHSAGPTAAKERRAR